MRRNFVLEYIEKIFGLFERSEIFGFPVFMAKKLDAFSFLIFLSDKSLQNKISEGFHLSKRDGIL